MVVGIGSRIRELRRGRGLTQREFAKAVGIHHTYLSKLENDRVETRPAAETIGAMAEALGVDRDWLLVQCGRPPQTLVDALDDDPDWVLDQMRHEGQRLSTNRASYRLVGVVAAGLPIEANETAEAFDLADQFAPEQHFLLRVRGDSMIEDAIVDGDLAIIRPAHECIDGDVVVAMVDGEEATLKRFYREGRMIRLQPANASMDPIRVPAASVSICGIVVGVIRTGL